MHHTDKYSQHIQVFVGSNCSHWNLWYAACFEQEVPWHSGKTIECGFTLELVYDMMITYSYFHKSVSLQILK